MRNHRNAIRIVVALLAFVALATSAGPVHAASTEIVKFVLPFKDHDVSNRFFSDSLQIPAGKRLLIDEVSIYVELHETTDPAPVKAVGYLRNGQIPGNNGGVMDVYEPLGLVDWVDKSTAPFVGSTQGTLRESTHTFADSFLQVVFEMNETIQLAFDAGDNARSMAVVIGRFVKRPKGL